MTLPDEVYGRLLALRTGLRQFERWSENQAQAAGLTPAQHQLLLAIRGHADTRGPTIGDVADYLFLRHHSAVGLVDRADAAGLVTRVRDDGDQRVVRLQLTEDGSKRLETLSALHLEELVRLAPQFPSAWEGSWSEPPAPGGPRRADPLVHPDGVVVGIARVYDHTDDQVTRRILVDRLWPRGVSKSDHQFDVWLKEIAPTTALRKWYGHVPGLFPEFEERYQTELCQEPAKTALEQLRRLAEADPLVLVTATKNIDQSSAAVLRGVLAEG